MDQSTHEIQREREQTRAALTEKIELLEERVRDTKRAVKQKFDYRYQTDRQPWKMLGASVAVGFFLGKLFRGRSAPRLSAQPKQVAQVAQKSTIRGALVGAIVPMLVEVGKNAALRTLSSRGGATETRARDESRVLTPFRDEPPHHHHPTAVPTKPVTER